MLLAFLSNFAWPSSNIIFTKTVRHYTTKITPFLQKHLMTKAQMSQTTSLLPIYNDTECMIPVLVNF